MLGADPYSVLIAGNATDEGRRGTVRGGKPSSVCRQLQKVEARLTNERDIIVVAGRPTPCEFIEIRLGLGSFFFCAYHLEKKKIRQCRTANQPPSTLVSPATHVESFKRWTCRKAPYLGVAGGDFQLHASGLAEFAEFWMDTHGKVDACPAPLRTGHAPRLQCATRRSHARISICFGGLKRKPT